MEATILNPVTELKEKIKKIEGNYTFKSPYHKNKRLPFNILGYSHNKNYEVSVYTVQYSGWNKTDVNTEYKLSDIEDMINTGFLKLKLTR